MLFLQVPLFFHACFGGQEMVELWLKIMKNEKRKRKQLKPNYKTAVSNKSVQIREFKSAGFFSLQFLIVKKQLLFIGLLRVYKLKLLIGCVKEDFSFRM